LGTSAFVTACFADGLGGGFGFSSFGFVGFSAWDGRVSSRPPRAASHHHKAIAASAATATNR
jgi:hypothetical protein